MGQWKSTYKSLPRIKKMLLWAAFCFIAYLMIGMNSIFKGEISFFNRFDIKSDTLIIML